MSAAGELVQAPRRIRPFRSIRNSAKRWGAYLGVRLGLLPAPRDRGYLICATPRSGSNYLCELLASTGQLGKPAEYFNTVGRRRYLDPNYPKHPRAQVEIIRSTGATPNGIFAAKIMPLQYRRACKRVDLLQALPNLKFLRLRRRDLLGQAISMARAQQSGQFMSSQQMRQTPVYDVQRIRDCIGAVGVMEATWDELMRELGVRPLALDYEDVVRDPQAAVDRVATLMGLVALPPINPALVQVKVQRDRESDEWRQRFLADTGAEFRHLAL